MRDMDASPIKRKKKNILEMNMSVILLMDDFLHYGQSI